MGLDFSGMDQYDDGYKIVIDRMNAAVKPGEKDYRMDNIEMRLNEPAFIHGIIRKARPRVIAELGVAAGGSSCLILNAIKDLKDSRLYSVDVREDYCRDRAKKTGFLVEKLFPELVHKWTLYANGFACNHLDEIEGEIDLCLIDTVHSNPGEHLNILEVLPYMRKNGIIVVHDTALHKSNRRQATNCILLNTLKGKRIHLPCLEPDNKSLGLPNIGAIILDDDVESMWWPLFVNITLPWENTLGDRDYNDLLKHYQRFYPSGLVDIFVKSKRHYDTELAARNQARANLTKFWGL